MYYGLMPSKEQNIFRSNILTVFPNRDQLGRRILLLELGSKFLESSMHFIALRKTRNVFFFLFAENWKHKEVSLDEVFKGCVLFLEAAMLEPETQVNGASVIFDMDGLSLQQTWQFTPPFAKRIVDWLQDSVPLRVKAIHIINQPKIFQMVFALFKPFLREKLRNRIYWHGSDRESLQQHIAPKCLPTCYGGTIDMPKVKGEEWYQLLLKCDKEYLALNDYGYIKEREAKCKKRNKS